MHPAARALPCSATSAASRSTAEQVFSATSCSRSLACAVTIKSHERTRPLKSLLCIYSNYQGDCMYVCTVDQCFLWSTPGRLGEGAQMADDVRRENLSLFLGGAFEKILARSGGAISANTESGLKSKRN